MEAGISDYQGAAPAQGSKRGAGLEGALVGMKSEGLVGLSIAGASTGRGVGVGAGQEQREEGGQNSAGLDHTGPGRQK